MSVEVDFTQTNSVFQAAGSQLTWVFTWAGVLDNNHYYGASFMPDSNRSNLQSVSTAYDSDPASNLSIQLTIKNNGEDATFRAAVIQAPNKF